MSEMKNSKSALENKVEKLEQENKKNNNKIRGSIKGV